MRGVQLSVEEMAAALRSSASMIGMDTFTSRRLRDFVFVCEQSIQALHCLPSPSLTLQHALLCFALCGLYALQRRDLQPAQRQPGPSC